MKLMIVDDYAAVSRAAADLVAAVIQAKPHAALVLATGDTPMGLYRELAERRAQGKLDPSHLRAFQLDAYLGLGPDDPRSLYAWLERSFLRPLAIPGDQVVSLPGNTLDPQAVCRAYDEAVAAVGGFDLSVLGLGPNGHLGFNEPPADPHSPAHVVTLTEASIQSNAHYWGGSDRVPRRALTAGMANLLAACETVLVVSGARKHHILHRTVEGPVTPDVPASYLQQAANVTVIADQAAWNSSK